MARMFVIAALLVSLFFSSGYTEIYLWPLHGERLLSSSFSEYREGHYHAGIDLRTFGRIGEPCLAVGDGSVNRLKVAPAGYGKALYLKLDDGRTAVYAHLHGFPYALDSLVYHHRLERRTAWCDLSLPEGVYAYSVGDTVCYTGTTGTKAPHLHFEMRDEEERPFNPLIDCYSIPDNRAPILSALEVVPLSPDSRVNGGCLPETFLLRASAGDSYVLDDTLQLDGRFGFGVAVWDEQGFGRYFLAPLSVEFIVDADTVFHVQNEVFSYGQAGEIVLEYDLRGDGASGRHLLLYRKEGATRSDRGGPGVIHADADRSDGLRLERGVHDGRIIVRDSAGNVARAVFAFVLHDYPVIETARKLVSDNAVIVQASDPDGGPVVGRLFESYDGGAHWEPISLGSMGRFLTGSSRLQTGGVYRYVVRDDEGGVVERYFAAPNGHDVAGNVFCECIPSVTTDGLSVRLATDRILAETPIVTIAGYDSCLVCPQGPRSYIVHCPPGALSDGVHILSVTGIDYRGYPLRTHAAMRVFTLHSGARHRFPVSDSLTVLLEARSVRGRALCLVRETVVPAEHPGGLRPVSVPFSLEFPIDRMARPLRLVCRPAENVGLFRFGEGGEWGCIGVPSRDGGAVSINDPGIYAFFADGLPPSIELVATEGVPRASGFFRTVRYYVPVTEEGSGVDPYSIEATINDRDVVCEYDSIRKRLLIPIPRSFPAGKALLRVEISDRTGNRSAGDFGFMIE